MKWSTLAADVSFSRRARTLSIAPCGSVGQGQVDDPAAFTTAASAASTPPFQGAPWPGRGER
jgi:hypothetical protein